MNHPTPASPALPPTRRALLGLAALGLAVVPFAVSAPAGAGPGDAPGASAVLSPTSGPVGTVISITGTCPASTPTAQVSIGPANTDVFIAETTVDVDAVDLTYAAELTFPVDELDQAYPPYAYVVLVWCQDGVTDPDITKADADFQLTGVTPLTEPPPSAPAPVDPPPTAPEPTVTPTSVTQPVPTTSSITPAPPAAPIRSVPRFTG